MKQIIFLSLLGVLLTGCSIGRFAHRMQDEELHARYTAVIRQYPNRGEDGNGVRERHRLYRDTQADGGKHPTGHHEKQP